MEKKKYWFGIDGIDCTGKTSIVHALQSDLDFLEVANATVFDEFTSGASGEALRRVISEYRFLSLSNPPKTRWADTFLLMSDWAYKVESFSASNYTTAISDRTHLSIGGYQTARLKKQYIEANIDDITDAITNMIGKVHSSWPATCFMDILLLVDEKHLQDRIAIRGEQPLTNAEVETLLEAQERHRGFGAQEEIDTSNMSFGEVLNTVRKLILARFPQNDRR